MTDKLKIMYLHGYGSQFNPGSDKVKALQKLGEVDGPDIDYGKGQQHVTDQVVAFAWDKDYDLIVGTSMGGWLASHVCVRICVPFVALNPATSPSQSLRKHVTTPTEYDGLVCHIDMETVLTYQDINVVGGCGKILCEEGDEILDARKTIEYLKDFYGTKLIPGGNHRFVSLEQHLDELAHTAAIAGVVWGN
jgi:uncharacterized protein